MEQESVFISYSHKDVQRAERIIQLIKNHTQKDIWYDARLIGGEYYFSTIAEQIVKCTFFVFIVSDYSVVSDFCIRELEFAASERKKIIAVWLDNISIPPGVKLVIQNTHYLNYYSTTEDKFANDIEKAFVHESIKTKKTIPIGYFDDRDWQEKKYYLPESEIRKIEDLLERENRGKFTACFEPKNAVLLGLAYEMGIGIEKNIKKAKFYYYISGCSGNADGEYLLRNLSHQNMESSELNQHRTVAAEKNSVFALIDLGNDYYCGENGCELNWEKACELYKKAAEQGNPEAMYSMAYAYRYGEGVEEDFQLSLMYALQAMEHGFPRGFRILGRMYECGDYLDQDYKKAIEHYEKAIKRGDLLSLCFEGGVHGKLGDYSKMKDFYMQAVKFADENLIKSGLPYCRMAYLYEDGKGVEKDYVVASQYYIKAAERNNSQAKKYAVLCINQISSEEIRRNLLIKALELGCDDAGYYLGRAERKLEKDRLSENAIRFYTQGAEQGDMECVIELLQNYSFVIGNGQDRNDRLQAIRWFQFLFANVNQEFIEQYRSNNLLATYYYAYAIELDYDPDVNMPDRKFVQMYFQKSLEESPMHFVRILHFAVNGYLFAEKSGSGLEIDVYHSEELLMVLVGYLSSYFTYSHSDGNQELIDEWQKVLVLFRDGFDKLARCYATGKYIKRRNLKKAFDYNRMAKDFDELVKKNAQGNLSLNDIRIKK